MSEPVISGERYYNRLERWNPLTFLLPGGERRPVFRGEHVIMRSNAPDQPGRLGGNPGGPVNSRMAFWSPDHGKEEYMMLSLASDVDAIDDLFG